MSSEKAKLITRNCIICEKSISSAMTRKLRQEFGEPPEDATCWTTAGNYGSSLFDNEPGVERLEICICDECLKSKRKYVLKFAVETKVTAVTKW